MSNCVELLYYLLNFISSSTSTKITLSHGNYTFCFWHESDFLGYVEEYVDAYLTSKEEFIGFLNILFMSKYIKTDVDVCKITRLIDVVEKSGF